MAFTGNYYLDSPIFSTATAVWTDPLLTTKASDGYYVFSGEYRQQVSGLLQDIQSCEISPTGYKIRSFTSGQNIQNTPCLGDEQWYSSENFITIQLVESDGVTPRTNNTGADIIINLKRLETGCATSEYVQEHRILPGQSEISVANLTGVAACPECINTADTIQCYVDITPSYVVPTEFFFDICTIPQCTNYTVSTTSGTGQSYTYTACDGTESGGTIGGAGGYDADTFCAQTGTIALIGSELSISNNGSCTI